MELDRITFGYPIKPALELPKKLKADIGEGYFGKRLEGPTLQNLIEDLAKHQQVHLSEEELKTFLWPLAGRVLNFDLCISIFERLARVQVSMARTPGSVRLKYSAQPRDEWVPTEITRARLTKSKGVRLSVEILTGFAALEHAEVMVKPQVMWKLCLAVGFSRRGSKRWFGRANEFYRLWCAFLVPESSDRKIEMHRIGISDACIAHNRPILAARRSCPRHLPHNCASCPHGFDECEFSVRSYSWIRGKCINGHIGWFKPTDSMGLCIHCRGKEEKTA